LSSSELIFNGNPKVWIAGAIPFNCLLHTRETFGPVRIIRIMVYNGRRHEAVEVFQSSAAPDLERGSGGCSVVLGHSVSPSSSRYRAAQRIAVQRLSRNRLRGNRAVEWIAKREAAGVRFICITFSWVRRSGVTGPGTYHSSRGRGAK